MIIFKVGLCIIMQDDIAQLILKFSFHTVKPAAIPSTQADLVCSKLCDPDRQIIYECQKCKHSINTSEK